MVRIIRNPDNNLIAVIATHVSGEELTVQYTSDSPFSYLPGPGSNPKIEAIYDLTGGLNLRGDGAQSIIRSYHTGFTASTSYASQDRLRESVPELLAAFREAGFPTPPVIVPRLTQVVRALADWLHMPRSVL